MELITCDTKCIIIKFGFMVRVSGHIIDLKAVVGVRVMVSVPLEDSLMTS